jgi:mRNA interferase MazF
MKRGDVVTVAATGDYGKPRPAVIVQTDALSLEHASVVVCHLTSGLSDISASRVTIESSEKNGLRLAHRSWQITPLPSGVSEWGATLGASRRKI